MTTIPVERELLERLLSGLDEFWEDQVGRKYVEQARALLAEQPQAGAGADPVEMGELRVRLESGHKQFEFEEYSSAYALQDGTHYLYAAPQPAARHDQGDEVRRLREALEKCLILLERHHREEYRGGARIVIRNHIDMVRAAMTHSPKGEEE